MADEKKWYIRTEDGKVYGPADIAALSLWAQDGRIEPATFVSQDRKSWVPAQLMSELEMKWLVEVEPGKVFGPFNRAVVIRLSGAGELPPEAKVYRLHEFPITEDPPPVEKIVEKRVEVPVEKIVEKIVEVEPPPRTEIVVAEVVEPVAAMPPPKAPGTLFKDLGRSQLAALEAAARSELANAKRSHMPFNLFGSKRK